MAQNTRDTHAKRSEVAHREESTHASAEGQVGLVGQGHGVFEGHDEVLAFEAEREQEVPTKGKHHQVLAERDAPFPERTTAQPGGVSLSPRLTSYIDGNALDCAAVYQPNPSSRRVAEDVGNPTADGTFAEDARVLAVAVSTETREASPNNTVPATQCRWLLCPQPCLRRPGLRPFAPISAPGYWGRRRSSHRAEWIPRSTTSTLRSHRRSRRALATIHTKEDVRAKSGNRPAEINALINSIPP
jgi:hypothetical protein